MFEERAKLADTNLNDVTVTAQSLIAHITSAPLIQLVVAALPDDVATAASQLAACVARVWLPPQPAPCIFRILYHCHSIAVQIPSAAVRVSEPTLHDVSKKQSGPHIHISDNPAHDSGSQVFVALQTLLAAAAGANCKEAEP